MVAPACPCFALRVRFCPLPLRILSVAIVEEGHPMLDEHIPIYDTHVSTKTKIYSKYFS